MYVNQIDTFINNIIDDFYIKIFMNQGPGFDIIKKIAETGNNFADYQPEINKLLRSFKDAIDTEPITKIVSNQESIEKITNTVERYIAYYFFFTISYHYNASIIEFRNNMIQYTKTQESSDFKIKNFFNPENNFRIVKHCQIIKDVSEYILLTDLQKQAANKAIIQDAIQFIRKLGDQYVEAHLLKLIDDQVVVNEHNLIKTVIFVDFFKLHDRAQILTLLGDVEEENSESIYIDIVTNKKQHLDMQDIKGAISDIDTSNMFADDIIDMVYQQKYYIEKTQDKTAKLLDFRFVTPIVDDFIRYHRDTEHIENETKLLPTNSDAENGEKNIKAAIQKNQRKKKENTRANIIVNKYDIISDYYSAFVAANPELKSRIRQLLQGPLSHRKAVMSNHLEEEFVMFKMNNINNLDNEYYLELQNIIDRVYFGFKNFQKIGVSIDLKTRHTIETMRWCNVEFLDQSIIHPIECHTATAGHRINMVGLSVAPLTNFRISDMTKQKLVNIRDITFNYYDASNRVVEFKSNNGIEVYLGIIRYFFVETINVEYSGCIRIKRSVGQMQTINPDLVNRVIYWSFDTDLDTLSYKTFENVNSYNSQDSLIYISGYIYDEIHQMLRQKLVKIVKDCAHLSQDICVKIMYAVCDVYNLPITPALVREYLAKYYIPNRKKITATISRPTGEAPKLAEYAKVVQKFNQYDILLDVRNPNRIKKYEPVTASIAKLNTRETIREVTCRHVDDWNRLNKMRRGNVNAYNHALTEFIEKYTSRIDSMDYVCNICGQVIPFAIYAQDGVFDPFTKNFTASYIPNHLELYEIKEYAQYEKIIEYLDSLIDRISLITGTRVFASKDDDNKDRKIFIKNVIDIMVEHNAFNLKKRITDEQHIDDFSIKYNIRKTLDAIYFFEIDDTVIEYREDANSTNIDEHNLKYNNMLLYFTLLYISELSGMQIVNMYNDKFANIYVFQKYSDKLFEDLRIRKSTSGDETVEITKYPVLCYLIYAVSYFLSLHRVWKTSQSSGRKVDVIAQKTIINTIVDIMNGISEDTNANSASYVYRHITSILYTNINNIFADKHLISMILKKHEKYFDKSSNLLTATPADKIATVFVDEYTDATDQTRKLLTFKISTGVLYQKPELMPQQTQEITNRTNCENGEYYILSADGNKLQSQNCKYDEKQANGDRILLLPAYYYNMQKVANARCITGLLHQFQDQGNGACQLCAMLPKHKYNRTELDQLNANIMEKSQQKRAKIMEIEHEIADHKAAQNRLCEKLDNDLTKKYKQDVGSTLNKTAKIVDDLVAILEQHIDSSIRVGVSEYPIYIKDRAYIINHDYNGALLQEPVIFPESENRIKFTENHRFFHTDVYYYTDNKHNVDVYYDAINMYMVGIKEKHKDFATQDTKTNKLIISPSIRDRILNMGFASQYIEISQENMAANKTSVLNDIMRVHVMNLKNIVENISSIIFKIHHDSLTQQANEALKNITTLDASQRVTDILTKYRGTKFVIGDIFEDWVCLRESLVCKSVDWIAVMDTALPKYVDSAIIGKHDETGNKIIYYLMSQFTALIQQNPDKTTALTMCQIVVDAIIYIHSVYNIEKQQRCLDVLRFGYALGATSYMLNTTEKGKGYTRETVDLYENVAEENDLQNSEKLYDMQEAADSIDLGTDYFDDGDNDADALD